MCTRGAAGERAFPLPEPRQPPAAAADARPAPPPSQSPPPVALARPLPSPRSVVRLRVCRAALRTRAPAAAARVRTERRTRGARGAPSQRQSDDEPRRGGRGEQVSASAGLGGSEGERAEQGRGTAGPNVDALQKRLCPLRHPRPLPGSALRPVPAGARAPLPSRHPRSGRTNKAHFAGGACPARAQSVGSQCVPRARLGPPSMPGSGVSAGRTWVGQAAAGSRAGARAGGGGAQLRRPRAPGPEAGPTGGAAAPSGRAFLGACCSAPPRRQVGPMYSHPSGGGGCGRPAGAGEGRSPCGAPLLPAGGLARFPPPR